MSMAMAEDGAEQTPPAAPLEPHVRACAAAPAALARTGSRPLAAPEPESGGPGEAQRRPSEAQEQSRYRRPVGQEPKQDVSPRPHWTAKTLLQWAVAKSRR